MSGFIRHDWSAGRNPTGGTPVPRSMGILPVSGPDRQAFTFADITSNCTRQGHLKRLGRVSGLFGLRLGKRGRAGLRVFEAASRME